jgi:NADH-quinone oxidoreductase subunit M
MLELGKRWAGILAPALPSYIINGVIARIVFGFVNKSNSEAQHAMDIVAVASFDYITFVVLIPLVISIRIILVPEGHVITSRIFALTGSLLVFIATLIIWVIFDNGIIGYQIVTEYSIIPQLNINLSLGVDGIALAFVILTGLLTPICILSSWYTINHRVKEYYALFILIEACVILVFTTIDFFVFYIAFEVVLIPIYLIIGFYGSRERKVRASYFFFLYTLVGSVLLLAAILYIWLVHGTTDITELSQRSDNLMARMLIWTACFFSFAVKVPIFPVHIWLPEAHVEAPTPGSVFLAGILLKLGTYGLLRFSVPIFPAVTVYFTPLVVTIALCGVIYASLTAIRQTDIKRIIAYSSVAHMNFTVLGVFAWNNEGLAGGILQILSHGLVASAIFLCVGVVYDRYHSRLVTYFGGRAQVMPIYIIVFLYFTIANIAIPGTSSFVGEFVILLGVYQLTTVGVVLSCASMVLGGAYSLWIFNRLAYGHHKTGYLTTVRDMGRIEIAIRFPLVALSLLIGLYPEVFLVDLQAYVDSVTVLVMNGKGNI